MKLFHFKYQFLKLNKTILLFLILIIFDLKIYAQCISTFPYQEGFELNLSWTSGGVNSDWTWGVPNHPTISDAGDGQKSWCIGGLNGSSYNDSQLSFLESPCFDFSNLDNPWISFKLFWETEFRWDGATFQYTLNNGSTWSNLGAFNDPIDCLNENWFNYNDITWITSANPKHGWSGRIGNTSGSCTGGNGSGQWRTAKHCMQDLAGQSNVKFRFLFGSGNSCNDYDGFAIDDIVIENTEAYTANFNYTCLNSTNVLFNNQSLNCSQTFYWEFGDPASGVLNASASQNPMHNFSGPGTYTVTLRTSGPCNEPGFFSRTITILDAESIIVDVSCFGQNTGEITVNTDQNATFLWNSGRTTNSISNLFAGNYTCEISKTNACPLNLNLTVNQNPELDVSFTTIASCTNSCNGTLNAILSGGEAPYSYQWSHSDLNQNSFAGLCSGIYQLSVLDAKGCITVTTANVNSLQKPNLVCEDLNLCIGSFGFLTASGADFYQWTPQIGLDNTTNSTVFVSVEESMTYQLIGTSVNECKDTLYVNVNLSDVFAPIANFSFSPTLIDIYDTEVQFLNQSSDANIYFWSFSDIATSSEINPRFKFPSNEGANYLVCLEVENEIACKDKFCELIKIDGKPSIFVPNSFTPNKDEINDLFFPVIRDIKPENYLFSIYNRWGELIFSTKNINGKWDGTFKNNKVQNGIYSWEINYIDLHESETKLIHGFVELRD